MSALKKILDILGHGSESPYFPSMVTKHQLQNTRPLGITPLSIFFMAATVITIVAAISLLFPNGFLEPIWRLNPRGRIGLGAIGMWSFSRSPMPFARGSDR
jgi:hypothetical protein